MRAAVRSRERSTEVSPLASVGATLLILSLFGSSAAFALGDGPASGAPAPQGARKEEGGLAAPSKEAEKGTPGTPKAEKGASGAPKGEGRRGLRKLFPGAEGKGQVFERIVAIVNEDIILLSEVEERVGPIVAEMQRRGEITERNQGAQIMLLRRRVLDLLIDERLMLQQAQQLKLGVTSEEIDRALEEIRKQNNVEMDELVKALAQQGMTLAQYRQDLRKQILRLKVVNAAVRSRVSVSDEEVRAYYDQMVRGAGGQRSVHASHIFIAIPDGATPAEVERRRRLAGEIVRRARAGEDFAKLAKEYSEDSATKDEGGDLGYLTRGSLPKALEEVVFHMEAGEVRGPIRASRGFHVIKVLGRRDEGVKPFAEVKEQLRQQLYAQEMEKATKTWLQELRKKSHIEIRLQVGG